MEFIKKVPVAIKVDRQKPGSSAEFRRLIELGRLPPNEGDNTLILKMNKKDKNTFVRIRMIIDPMNFLWIKRWGFSTNQPEAQLQ